MQFVHREICDWINRLLWLFPYPLRVNYPRTGWKQAQEPKWHFAKRNVGGRRALSHLVCHWILTPSLVYEHVRLKCTTRMFPFNAIRQTRSSISILSEYKPVSKPNKCKKNTIRSLLAIALPLRCRNSTTFSKTHTSSDDVSDLPLKSSLSWAYAVATKFLVDGFVKMDKMSGLPHAYVVCAQRKCPHLVALSYLVTLLLFVPYPATIEHGIKVHWIMLPTFQHRARVLIEAGYEGYVAGTGLGRYMCSRYAENTLI